MDAPASCPPELKGPIAEIQSTLGCRSTKIGYGGVRAPLATTFGLNTLLAQVTQVCGQTPRMPNLPGLKVFGAPKSPVLPCALPARLEHDSPPRASDEPGNDALEIALLGKKPHASSSSDPVGKGGLPPEAPQRGLPSSSSDPVGKGGLPPEAPKQGLPNSSSDLVGKGGVPPKAPK